MILHHQKNLNAITKIAASQSNNRLKSRHPIVFFAPKSDQIAEIYTQAAVALNVPLYFATLAESHVTYKPQAHIFVEANAASIIHQITAKIGPHFTIFTESPIHLELIAQIHSHPKYFGGFDKHLVLRNSRIVQKSIFEKDGVNITPWVPVRNRSAAYFDFDMNPPYYVSDDRINSFQKSIVCHTPLEVRKAILNNPKLFNSVYVMVEQVQPGFKINLQTSYSFGKAECSLVSKKLRTAYIPLQNIRLNAIPAIEATLASLAKSSGIYHGFASTELIISAADKVYVTDFYPCATQEGAILVKHRSSMSFNPAALRLANLLDTGTT